MCQRCSRTFDLNEYEIEDEYFDSLFEPRTMTMLESAKAFVEAYELDVERRKNITEVQEAIEKIKDAIERKK
jgi:hypothetical protein